MRSGDLYGCRSLRSSGQHWLRWSLLEAAGVFQWLFEEGIIDCEPASRLPAIKRLTHLPRPETTEVYAALPGDAMHEELTWAESRELSIG